MDSLLVKLPLSCSVVSQIFRFFDTGFLVLPFAQLDVVLRFLTADLISDLVASPLMGYL